METSKEAKSSKLRFLLIKHSRLKCKNVRGWRRFGSMSIPPPLLIPPVQVTHQASNASNKTKQSDGESERKLSTNTEIRWRCVIRFNYIRRQRRFVVERTFDFDECCSMLNASAFGDWKRIRFVFSSFIGCSLPRRWAYGWAAGVGVGVCKKRARSTTCT